MSNTSCLGFDWLFQTLSGSLQVCSPPSDQGARHAEEGVPRAGGDVRGRDGGVPLIRCGESGNAQGRAAGDAEKRLLSGEEGEAAALKGKSKTQWERQQQQWLATVFDPVVLLAVYSSQPRLKCLSHIVKRLDAEHKEFITNLLPEVQRRTATGRSVTTLVPHLTGGCCCVFQVIICTKEVSVGARKSAYNLLVEIGNAFVRFCGNAKGNTLSASVREEKALLLGSLLFSLIFSFFCLAKFSLFLLFFRQVLFSPELLWYSEIRDSWWIYGHSRYYKLSCAPASVGLKYWQSHPCG